MNKVYKRLIMLMMVGLIPVFSLAQNEEDIAKFLGAGAADASKLVSAYFTPPVKSISFGMASGWVTTAKTHKPFGFDFGVSINLAFIPDEDDYFDPASLGLSPSTTFSNTTNPGSGAPTFMGPKDATTYSATYDPDGTGPIGTQTVNIDGPEGLNIKKSIGFAAIPVPVAQVGIGLIKNTDLKLRMLPKLNYGSSEISMFGVGIMHDIKQHIKGVKLLPFDLSLLVAYNTFKGESDLSNTNTSDTRPDSPDGRGIYKLNSITFQALVSKKLAVLTVYGGAGFSTIKTKVAVNGTYTIDAPIDFPVVDPVDIDIKSNSPFFVAGARLKFGPLYFNGNYTIQKYKTLSVGFGFAFL